MKAFRNALVYVEGEGLKRCDLVFDRKIEAIGGEIGGAEVIELSENAVVLPGFIDEHIHGAGGADAMDGTREALKTIAETVAGEGTTSFLATTMTQSRENILHAMKAVKAYREEAPEDGARILGIHLEGPFIAAAHKGAQPLEYVAKPDVNTFDEYNSASGNAIKIVTLAPEEAGADELVKHLASENIVPSIGHTGAKSADIRAAVRCGAKNVTLNCELIADTIHVSVPAIQLLTKCKHKDKLTLITDAMRAKGLADGESELGGQVVIVKNGEARLKDGTLAGSVLRMNRAIANLVEKVGIAFLQAVDYATINPAKTLGVDGETGSIRVGKNADFAVLDDKFNVLYTIRDGKIIYRA